jgi:hypothetical protein
MLIDLIGWRHQGIIHSLAPSPVDEYGEKTRFLQLARVPQTHVQSARQIDLTRFGPTRYAEEPEKIREVVAAEPEVGEHVAPHDGPVDDPDVDAIAHRITRAKDGAQD